MKNPVATKTATASLTEDVMEEDGGIRIRIMKQMRSAWIN